MKYNFSLTRQDYLFNITDAGTSVVNKLTGENKVVPYGDEMVFSDSTKFSKNTLYIINHIESHLESYVQLDTLCDLPVNFIRMGSLIQNHKIIDVKITDIKNKVVVTYINSAEYTGFDDPAFDPLWDKNNDDIIDSDITILPDYVDKNVFNTPWKNYVAKYWTDSWRETLKIKIDAAAKQNFDGVMLDVMTGYRTWLEAYPNMSKEFLREKVVELFQWIHDYAKSTYGDAFLITANIDHDANQYFKNLGQTIDAGYYQNSLFNWNGSGIIQYSSTQEEIDFLKSQGLNALSMNHLSSGEDVNNLGFTSYNETLTTNNFLKLFQFAIETGETPYLSPVFMRQPYEVTPHYVRMLSNTSDLTNTIYNDYVIGNNLDNVISTGDGDDVVAGLGGNDIIDLGRGIDTTYFLENKTNYTITNSNNTIYVKGENENVAIKHGEYLRFADQTVLTSDLFGKVVNNLPTGAVGINGQAVINGILTVSNTLSDIDGLGDLSYQWFRNEIIIPDATQTVYVITKDDIDQRISVKASYSDLDNNVDSKSSSPTGKITEKNPLVIYGKNAIDISLDVYSEFVGNATIPQLQVNINGKIALPPTLVTTDPKVFHLYFSEKDITSLDILVSNTTFIDRSNYSNIVFNKILIDSNPIDATKGIFSNGASLPGGFTYSNSGTIRFKEDAFINSSQIIQNYGYLNNNITGNNGNETIAGGMGDDTINGLDGIDTAVYSGVKANYSITKISNGFAVLDNIGNEGTDALINIERLQFSDQDYNLVANQSPTGTANTTISVNDLLIGTVNANKLNGLAGNDTLIGGLGTDTLTGGAGADTFKFASANESTFWSMDVITDFKRAQGDKIDLSAIDSNANVTGDQGFKLVSAFTADATGQLYFDAKTHILYGSIDADSAPEFAIKLNGVKNLVVDDFLL